jgi:hypothetical protein
MEAPFRVIDADGHVTENVNELFNLWYDRMPEEYRRQAPAYFSDDRGRRFWVIEGKVWPSYEDSDPAGHHRVQAKDRWFGREGEYDPHKRMPDMDFMGIDLSVIFPTRLMGVPAVVKDAGLAVAISRAYNEWLATEYCAAYPDRLKGTAMVPVQDPEMGVRELERAVEQGLVGGIFIPHVDDVLLDNKHFYPIYEAAQEMGVPIAIHNNSVINPARHVMKNYALANSLNTMSSMIGLGSLLLGGVLDDFPRLKIAFLESGAGWVPYVMERLAARQHAVPYLFSCKNSVEEYVRSDQLYYSCEPDELTVPMVAQLVGEERLVMGSDYAHFDGSSPESVRLVMQRTDISDDLKRKILSDNPARLYNI